jgi:hypothetical protein
MLPYDLKRKRAQLNMNKKGKYMIMVKVALGA